MKKALVLFSGGKDSMLSAMLLIENGYEVYLVHYDNSFEIGNSNIKNGYKRLVKKYGQDKVKYLGIKKIDGIFRSLIKEFYNLKVNDILKEYGKITFSEFNCLTCRVSMYILSIIICQQLKINYLADGARRSQLFAIEQDEMLNLFTNLFKEYNINFLLPVKDLKDDYEEKNAFLMRGFIPKVNESQCLLGMPLCSNKLDNEILLATKNIYTKYLYPKINDQINKYSNIEIGANYL